MALLSKPGGATSSSDAGVLPRVVQPCHVFDHHPWQASMGHSGWQTDDIEAALERAESLLLLDHPGGQDSGSSQQQAAQPEPGPQLHSWSEPALAPQQEPATMQATTCTALAPVHAPGGLRPLSATAGVSEQLMEQRIRLHEREVSGGLLVPTAACKILQNQTQG